MSLIPTTVEIELTAVSNTADGTSQGTANLNQYRSFHPTVGDTNIAFLPPVYVSDAYAIQLKVTLPSLYSTWRIDSCSSLNNDVGFNYTITPFLSYAMITITNPTSGTPLQIVNSWYPRVWTCLMDDLSYDDFPSPSDATAATNPAFLDLTQLTFTNLNPRTETHDFTLGVSQAGANSQTIAFSIDGTLYNNPAAYTTPMRALIAQGQ